MPETPVVMLASDGSGHALQAAAFLKGHLRGDPDTRVMIVHVIRPLPAWANELLDEAGDDAAAMARRTGQDVIDRTVAALDLATARVQATIVTGYPAEEITRLAREHRVSMVVMGSRGLTDAPGIHLGSVSERVSRLAPCPVLIVRSPDQFQVRA